MYEIPKVNRNSYIQVFDRAKLQYLNFDEKLGCMYCGYANGLLAYISEIAARTEEYWCGIMHKDKPGFKHRRYQKVKGFAPYGDSESVPD